LLFLPSACRLCPILSFQQGKQIPFFFHFFSFLSFLLPVAFMLLFSSAFFEILQKNEKRKNEKNVFYINNLCSTGISGTTQKG
jgi:hypothetical protein